MNQLAPILTFWPLVVVSLTLLVGRSYVLQKWISGLGALVQVGLSFYVLQAVLASGDLVVNFGGWGWGFAISFVVDGFSALMLAVTAVVYLAVVIYAVPDETSENSGLFFPLVSLTITGISGAFSTHDLFNLYVWFEVILVSSFVSVSLTGARERLGGAVKYVVLNMISSLVFLAAAGLTYHLCDSLNMSVVRERMAALPEEHQGYVGLVSMLLFSAFAIKSALFPFFQWLPASYHRMSPAMSALFAGLLTKVGLYAIFRVSLTVFSADNTVGEVLLYLAPATMLAGVLGAIVQKNVRRILGFHIVSQVGYIAFAGVFFLSEDPMLRTAGISFGIFYIVHHILVKANLYLVSGILGTMYGSERLGIVYGARWKSGLVAVLFAIPALSLAGIPPSSGFWAKFTMIKAGLENGYYWAVLVMVAAGFLTVFSMTKIWVEGFWGKGDAEVKRERPPLAPVLGSLVLGLCSIAIGLYPDPLFEAAKVAADSLLTAPSSIGMVP